MKKITAQVCPLMLFDLQALQCLNIDTNVFNKGYIYLILLRYNIKTMRTNRGEYALKQRQMTSTRSHHLYCREFWHYAKQCEEIKL